MTRRYAALTLALCLGVSALAGLTSGPAAAALPTPVVTLTGPATVAVGFQGKLDVTVSTPAAPGETVTLERLNGLTWSVVESTALDTSSQTSFWVTPTKTGKTQYRVRIAATATHNAGTSKTYTMTAVLPTPTITLTPVPANAEVNKPVRINVAVSGPATPGETVTLQKWGGLSWGSPEDRVLNGSSTTYFDRTPTAVGTTRYRVIMAKTTTHLAATSAEYVMNAAAMSCGPTVLRQDGTAWVCSYHDEFDGAVLDRRYWVPQVTETSGVINGDPDQYTCYVDSQDVINQHDGVLDLSMKELPVPRSCGGTLASNYIAGQVTHYGTFSQTYGRFEVRAKLPPVRVRGIQETFWLWPVDSKKYGTEKWAAGEIDFAEFYSRYPDEVKPYVHYITNEDTDDPDRTRHCPIDYDQFNTYRLEWYPGLLKIFVNDVACMESTYPATNVASPAPFDQPFFLALTQAMGRSSTNPYADNRYDTNVVPDVVTTQVDYVRIWK